MGEYKDENGELRIYRPLIEQLDVTFLANDRSNFDPEEYNEQFNYAGIPELQTFTKNILELSRPADKFLFAATFQNAAEKEGKIMICMEQISVKFNPSQSFKRSLTRMENGRDSLLRFIRHNDLFIEKWKQNYKLYAPQQQMFLFASLLSVCTQIKYIDIEFRNQPVLITLQDDSSNITKKVDLLKELIDDRDVIRDEAIFKHHEGTLVPPNNTMEYIMGNNDFRVACKSDILIKALREIQYQDKTEERQPKWMQRLTDQSKIQHGLDSLHLFTEDEATFLRFSECIRKYVLEYELGDTLHTLWPWYKNSLHCGYPGDDNNDCTVYRDLLIKYNLSKRFTITTMRSILRQSWKVGSQCQVLRRETNTWYDGVIKRIINDEDGAEWLYVGYIDHNGEETMRIERSSRFISHSKEATQTPSIRHKRKFAARNLLHETEIKRNLNVIKQQLNLCLDAIMDKICFHGVEKEAKKDATFKQNYQQQWYSDEDGMVDDVIKYINNDDNGFDWTHWINTKNTEFKESQNSKDKYKRFGLQLENIESIDISKPRLPLFEQFVQKLFIESDRNKYEQHRYKYRGTDLHFYRQWIGFWRDAPNWYNYNHDVLLLELVMRNGINVDKITEDLDGEKRTEYKLRLDISKKKKTSGLTLESGLAYYEFKTWCKQKMNILHRLKYVTNTIICNLEKREPSLLQIRIPLQNKFDGKSIIFSNYQYQIHKTFMDPTPKLTLRDSSKDILSNSLFEDEDDSNGHYEDTNKIPMSKIISSPQILRAKTEVSQSPQLGTINEAESSFILSSTQPSKNRVIDPFQDRDIEQELIDALQTFDLMKYGESMVSMMINQLKQEEKEAYWNVLSQLLNYLPYPFAAEAMQNCRNFLQHVGPDKLEDLSQHIVDGTEFKPGAALTIAEFFDDLSEQDMVQEEIWQELSKQFEQLACDKMNKIESDHLLFLLLTVPLAEHGGKSLVNIALEQRRLTFLNSDRIANVMKHMYRKGFLMPNGDVQSEGVPFSDLLQALVFQPFEFYFSAQGYHWTSGILFMLYLSFVCFYAYLRPLSGDIVNDPTTITFEIILWTCNLGYIMFEGFELKEKGAGGYFNLGVKGQTNLMDVFICLLWITLLGLRITLVLADISFTEGEAASPIQNVYVFLFGLQITILTLRSLTLFSNTEYLGTLLRIIKLMFIEIYKFMFIFIIAMIGILFGLWFIVLTNDGESDDFEVDNLFDGIKYVFQVFIGTGDLGGVGDQTIGIIFMVFATFFGTLILTNLLIALMTTEYENVSEQAKQEVIFNQIELTFDLSSRSRLMPPPLNIIVVLFADIVYVINIITSLFFKYNMYAYLHYDSFKRLKQRRYKYGYPLFVCLILWVIFAIGIYNKDAIMMILSMSIMICFWIIAYWINPKFGHHKKDHDPDQSLSLNIKVKPTKYFQNMGRQKLMRWYCSCFYNCCKSKKVSTDEDDAILNIHHKSCYAELILTSQSDKNKTSNAVNGITIAQYIDEYEKAKNVINSDDKAVLKQLTSSSLFCKKCYRPFPNSKDPTIIQKQLAAPYDALLDFSSAIVFVIIPIAYFPMVLLFCALAIKEKIADCFEQDDDNQEYTTRDYDAEYFPRKDLD